jgi:hypothetical protein
MLVTAIAPSGTELKQIELGDNAVLCLSVLVYQKGRRRVSTGRTARARRFPLNYSA